MSLITLKKLWYLSKLHPSVTHPVKPYPVTFCVSPDNFSTPRHPLQYQIRPDEHFCSPVPNHHWFEIQSGGNSYRLNLEIFTITLLRRAIIFVHLLPLLPESRTSERLCHIRDVLEDIICISKDIVSLKAKFTIGLHKIFHRGQ